MSTDLIRRLLAGIEGYSDAGIVATNAGLIREAAAALSTRPATSPITGEAREAIARIIDPHGFRSWQSLYDYGIKQGDSEEEAKGTADWAHKKECDDALAKADAILAALPLAPREGWQEEVGEFARALEKGDFGMSDNVAKALNERMCCDGHMCGCRGSSVGEYLAHELRAATGKLPDDVRELVIAAREFWDANEDGSEESGALDKALEAFSSRVPYANEPDASAPAALSRTGEVSRG